MQGNLPVIKRDISLLKFNFECLILKLFMNQYTLMHIQTKYTDEYILKEYIIEAKYIPQGTSEQ